MKNKICNLNSEINSNYVIVGIIQSTYLTIFDILSCQVSAWKDDTEFVLELNVKISIFRFWNSHETCLVPFYISITSILVAEATEGREFD